MRTLLVFLACSLAAVMAAPPQNKGIIINLENGELCLNSLQCKSSCCHRTSGVSLARCIHLAADKQECSTKHGQHYGVVGSGLLTGGSWLQSQVGDTAAVPLNKTLYGTYYRCPCESGLKCKTDISICGSITNTNFGVCYDPSNEVPSDTAESS
ncbi:COL Colipase, partial [Polyodon spathula]|nr:COL Colipase [Polyodon spathula]